MNQLIMNYEWTTWGAVKALGGKAESYIMPLNATLCEYEIEVGLHCNY